MKRTGPLAIILLLLGSHGSALTMEEAVGTALANHPRIRQFDQASHAQAERVESRRSPFWPELSLGYSYIWESGQIRIFPDTDQVSIFSAKATYNLFRGFSDRQLLDSEASRYTAARYQQRGVEQDVALEVRRAFLEVLRARDRVSVEKESVDLLERQRRDAEIFYREGVFAKNDLLRVEVELATARQTLLSAESGLRTARRGLERAMGAPVREGEEPADPGPFDPVRQEEANLRDEMMGARSELLFLQALREARVQSRKAIQGGYYPEADLTLAYRTFGDDLAPTGTDDSFPDRETNVTFELTWTLFDGFRKKHDILAEEREIRVLEEQIRDTGEELSLQLTRAVEAFDLAAARKGVAEKSVEQAQENYRITENQFRERVATTTDLLDARVFLTRARNEASNAFYDLLQARVALDRIVERPLPAARAGAQEHPPGR